MEHSAKHLDISLESTPHVHKEIGGKINKIIIEKSNISKENIPVNLIYVPTKDGEVKLAWKVVIHEKTNANWWNMRVDALTGEVLNKNNWTSHDTWGTSSNAKFYGSKLRSSKVNLAKPVSRVVGGSNRYNVFAIPTESPTHGNRTLEDAPGSTSASPFGWHDVDGANGAEFTTTRGNNVYAYEDRGNNNAPGYSTDGGSNLEFDFGLDFSQTTEANQDAAITNLFYWNNMLHDVYFHYGFDEVSGNFQQKNYTGEGQGGDYVNAEAQDGSGLNNANFSSPPDGSNGTMQMFLWGTPSDVQITINSPSTLAGTILYPVPASFGAEITDALLTADIVLFDDGTASGSEGCSAATSDNATALAGKIALIDRGSCEFGVKVLNAENAGAIAVIVCNNEDGDPITMGGGAVGDQVTIPAIMITKTDCAILKEALNDGLNVSFNDVNFGLPMLDGDFDNGIIAHEYGHGISTRLAGGPSNSGCLSNDEQMGEGWSDYFGLMLTIEPGDTRTDIRGVGTYAIGGSPTDTGIRNAPYSTDFAVNNYTYGNVKDDNISIPHGVGFIWGTMIWDMTWDLIDKYGYDTDLYNGTGGNNIAMQLVLDGIKLQPCSPGLVDGRDAILLADRINNDGANQGLIWKAFARRGLGLSADQGSTGSKTDQTEAFDLPDIAIDGALDVTSVQAGARITVSANAKSFVDGQSNILVSGIVPSGATYVDGSASNSGFLEGDKVLYATFNMEADETAKRSYQLDVDAASYSAIKSIDRMENGSSNWTTSGTNDTWDNKSWERGAFSQYSGLTSWIASNTGTASEQILAYNPSVNVTENSALSFWHFYDTEAGWDGGVVEISVDGGTSWEDVGSKAIFNGYNSTLGTGSALADRNAFSGKSNGHINTVIDLSTYNGQTALIRFRFAEDATTSVFGWAIDDVSLIDLVTITNKVCVKSSETAEKCVELVNIVEKSASQNILPTIANISRKIAFNGTYIFSPNSFLENFTDSDFDFIEKIIIKSLPTDGTLKLNDTAVSVDDEIAYTNITNLSFEATTDFSGTNSFEWNAYDGYGFATTNANFQIKSNSPPTASNIAIDYTSQVFTFSATDFETGFSDTDEDSLTKIKITTLPNLGKVKFDGSFITTGQEIMLADISKLTYFYTNGATASSLADSFSWNGFDGMNYSASEAQVLITLDPVLGINDEFLVKSTMVYPNPVADVVTIKINNNLKENVNATLFNSLGQKLEYKEVTKKSNLVELNFNLQALPMGIYILQIKQGGFISSQKVIKK